MECMEYETPKKDARLSEATAHVGHGVLFIWGTIARYKFRQALPHPQILLHFAFSQKRVLLRKMSPKRLLFWGVEPSETSAPRHRQGSETSSVGM